MRKLTEGKKYLRNDFLLGSGSTSQNGSWNTEAISASQMLSKKPDPLWQDIPHQKESIADFFFYPNMPSAIVTVHTFTVTCDFLYPKQKDEIFLSTD